MKTNLVQQRARQRNITPNFLRFKRTFDFIQEKVQDRQQEENKANKKQCKPNIIPKEAHQKQVDAHFKYIKREFSI